MLLELELDEDLFDFPIELHGLLECDDFEPLDFRNAGDIISSLEVATDTVLLMGGLLGSLSFTTHPSTPSKLATGQAAASSSVGKSGLCRGDSGAV